MIFIRSAPPTGDPVKVTNSNQMFTLGAAIHGSITRFTHLAPPVEQNQNRSQRMRVQEAHLLLNAGLQAPISHFLVLGLVAWIMWPVHSIGNILIFVLLVAIPVSIQLLLFLKHRRKDLSFAETQQIMKIFNRAALTVGLGWGYAGLCLFPPGDATRQLFLTFVMGGMSMSAVSGQHVSVRTTLYSIVPGVAPLAFSYAMSGEQNSILYAVLLGAYLFLLIGSTLRLNRTTMRSFELQLTNEDLLHDLQDQAIALKEAKEIAETANAAKSRFLAQASHDLRQPLHAIGLYIESLPESASKGRTGDVIGRIRSSLDVLSKLFDSLLDVTLLDTGQISARNSNFPIDAVLNQIRDEFLLVAKSSKVDLTVVPCGINVQSDPVLVRRIVQNLVSNAIRNADCERVLIGCLRRSGRADIGIFDNGRGISKVDQTRIFEEFTRLDVNRAGKSASPGLGLGLAIVKKLSDVLGLEVDLRSQQGKGSVFFLKGLERSTTPIPKREETPISGRKWGDKLVATKVLLVDDDPETLAATGALLQRWGCDVTINDGQNVPDVINVDILICDFELGAKLNGIEFIAAVRAADNQDLPALLISGNTSPDLRKAANANHLLLLHKPVRPAQLRTAIGHLITQSR